MAGVARMHVGRRSARRTRLLAGLGLLAAAALAAVLLLRGDAPERAPGPGFAGPPAGLTELWEGRASLVLARKWTSRELGAMPGAGAYSGAHVEVVNGTWYLFNRRLYPDRTCPGHADGGEAMGVDVRVSRDRGMTWSEPVAALEPTPGTRWSCAASDGDVFFDAARGTWGYLFQCMGDSRSWHGCYAERAGPDPMGAFAAPSPDPNPVVPSGSLWSAICDEPADRCHRPAGAHQVAEEGTFNVFHFDGQAWWVGFHGYDGVQGFRGIARTATFRPGGWEVDGAGGTPTDAVVSAADAAGWRESWQPGGPIGAGAAAIAEERGYFYQLVEIPDTNLACTPGQTWDLGLLRASSLATTTWEQYPAGNPLVYSSRAPEAGGKSPHCNVEYPGIFLDPGTGATYVVLGRATEDRDYDAIYVYRIEHDRNLLSNGDAALADTNGWSPLPADAPLPMTAERRPNESPDGTPYFGLACGEGGCTGASAHQDIPIGPDRAGQTLAFGGTFQAPEGDGELELAVQQHDATGREIDSAILRIDPSGDYARERGTLRIDARTTVLRVRLTPRAPGPLRADNLYLIPQDGCTAPDYPAC